MSTSLQNAAPASGSTYRFAHFELDLRAGVLSADGVRVPLQDLPLRLLGALAEQRGEVVTREALQRRLWPDKSFLDFEAGLNTAIRKLRQALGDDPRAPRYIATTRGYGYRLLVPVEIEAPAPESPAAPEAPTADLPAALPGPPLRRAGWPRWLALGGAALALGGLVWWLTPLPPPTVTRIFPITGSGALDYLIRPASDGARIFYLERNGGGWQAMQTSLLGGEPQPVPMPLPNLAILDVSPDGRLLLTGQIESRGLPLSLWTLPVQGGAPMRLGNLSALSAAWSHDGQWLLYALANRLWIARADGSGPRVLATFPDTVDWPTWSPDDRRVRAVVVNSLDGSTVEWDVKRDGTQAHPLFAGWTQPPSEGHGAWSPDGRYFFFTSSHDGAGDLWAVREASHSLRRSPRGPFRLTSGPTIARSATMHADGKRVYFYSSSDHYETRALDAGGNLIPFPAGADVLQPTYSSDGKWLAYQDASGGLWRSRSDGGDRRQLWPGNAGFPRWSPDSRTVALTAEAVGRPAAVYLVPRDGGAGERLAPQWVEVRDPDWSADGKTLVVSHLADPSHPSGPSNLATIEIATRRATPLPGGQGMVAPRYSPDGRYLAATAGDQRQLELLDLATGKWRVLAQGKALGISVWAPDSSTLYYQDLLGQGEALYRIRPGDARPERVADFSGALQGGVHRCALIGITPAGGVLMDLTFATSNLLAAEVSLP